MKTSLTSLAIILITSFLLYSFVSKKNSEQGNSIVVTSDKSTNNEKELRSANDKFYAALNAMFTGDLQPMISVWSHSDDVTLLGPFGGRLTGWNAVQAEFQKEAGMRLGGKVACTDLFIYPGTDIGFTVCVEEGQNMSADGKPVTVKFRATNIFRLENGEWKLVHHHTDISAPLQQAVFSQSK